MADKTDISKVADLELGDLLKTTSPLQKEMYLPDAIIEYLNKGGNGTMPREEDIDDIPTGFWNDMKKNSMATDIFEKMSVTPGSEGELNFGVNYGMDFLLYIYSMRNFPGYKIKDEYKDNIQICWVHNLGHNNISRIDMMIDNDPKQTITNTWLDIYSQNFMKWGYKKTYRKCVGDSKYSQEWTNELKPCTMQVPLPFLFSRKRCTALPLFLTMDDIINKSKIEFKMHYRTKISELLKMRMRKTADGPWVEIPYNWNVIVGVSDADQKLPYHPELYGCYSKITSEERNSWKDRIKNNKGKVYKMYYDDIIIINPDKTYTIKEPFTTELSCKTPCRGIFWVAQNQEGLKYNNYSNYTTNTYSVKEGEHPITKISMKHGGTTSRHQNLDYRHFNDMMNYHRLPSSPFYPGYQCLIFSDNLLRTDPDIGLIFNNDIKTNLTLSLERPNEKPSEKKIETQKDQFLESLLADPDRSDGFSIQRYKIFVFLYIMKKIEFPIADKIRVYSGNEKVFPD